MVELLRAPPWAKQRLAEVAAAVRVPVRDVLTEHDALWDSSPAALAEFESLFSGGAGAMASLGAALHLEQLAFADRCANVT